jgi:hypothetical protein
MKIASCNHGYVFIDEPVTGEMVTCFKVNSHSGNAATGTDFILKANGWQRTCDWTPGLTHGELVAGVVRI